MRRKRIHVSSGTYCRALAQFERRMMSQIDLTNDDSERVPAMVFGGFCFGCFFPLGMGQGVFFFPLAGNLGSCFIAWSKSDS